jgi:hypothetical protein
MRIWLLIITLICWMLIGLAGCATIPTPTPAIVKIRPTYTPSARNQPLQVEAFCSPTQFHTSIVRVSWQASQAEAENQELQVTTFKTGFEKGVFGALAPLSDKRLRLTGMAKEKQATTAGLQRLQVALYNYDQEHTLVNVEISNLEPGLLYFLRLQSKGETVGRMMSVEAPICVADIETGGE